MIVIDCEQGSPEWHMARAGVATASQFSRLVTPTKLQPSKQLGAYAVELAAERLLGRPVKTEQLERAGKWSDRGRELEPEALGWYGVETGLPVQRVGFVKMDDGLAGCSPDALVGEEGGLEIKCPRADTHLGYLTSEGVPGEYLPQIQGALFVTGRPWWDFLSFCPGAPEKAQVLRRVYPDARWQKALADAMPRLQAAIDAYVAAAKSYGWLPASEQPAFDPYSEEAFDRFVDAVGSHGIN